MLDARDPAHYLKQLVSDNTPQRLLWLDCTSQSTNEQGAWIERWKSGALGTTHWTSRKHERVDTVKPYNTSRGLWDAADRFCLPRRRTVLFAYDLALQLRVSRALVELPLLDWTVDRLVLERTAAWALFRDGDRTLLMCDLKSWCPVSFDQIRRDVTAKEGAVFALLAGELDEHLIPLRNVRYLRVAVLEILDWLSCDILGPFRPTGSGQSYAGFRRRFLTHKLLVHDDVARLQAERAAMWTGRCEAWEHGQLTDGPYIEYDLHAAYATIARDCAVPAVASGELNHPANNVVERIMTDRAVLAHVTVETSMPCLPARMGGRTVWPVGRFDTWIWEPELALAFQYCESVQVNKAYMYHREPALHDFADYVLKNMADRDFPYGKVPQRVLKHWSRCLVGRLGLRYRSWERFGYQDEPDLRLVTYLDMDDNTSTDMLIAGHDRFVLSDMSEAVDSLPQVPSWVMSECRRRLWTLMFEATPELVYVDTDSLVVKSNTESQLMMVDMANDQGWPLVRKGVYGKMTIHGPRNIVAESDRRVAGLPLTARQVAPLEFTGQVMRSIKESMRAGELDCVANIPRRFVLDSPDMRRQHLPDHKTAPFTVSPTITEDEV